METLLALSYELLRVVTAMTETLEKVKIGFKPKNPFLCYV